MELKEMVLQGMVSKLKDRIGTLEVNNAELDTKLDIMSETLQARENEVNELKSEVERLKEEIERLKFDPEETTETIEAEVVEE
jgi:chromosome segregation ATPase